MLAFLPAASQAKTFPKLAIVAPTAHLLIPSIKVNAVIRDMGLTPQGAMAVPGNTTEAGWYAPGTRPGDVGSAVIGGHNRWAKVSGVFVKLNQLRVGDRLSVVDAAGVSHTFVVRAMRLYNPTDDATDVFLSDRGTHLNLITCAGVWNVARQDYSKRLVVFTDLVVPPAMALKVLST